SVAVAGLAQRTSGKPSGRRATAAAVARISVSAVVTKRSTSGRPGKRGRSRGAPGGRPRPRHGRERDVYGLFLDHARSRSGPWSRPKRSHGRAFAHLRGDRGKPRGRAGLDQLGQPRGIEVAGDEISQYVEARLAHRRERGPSGDEPGRHPGQQRTAKFVVLERLL